MYVYQPVYQPEYHHSPHQHHTSQYNSHDTLILTPSRVHKEVSQKKVVSPFPGDFTHVFHQSQNVCVPDSLF